MIYTLGQTLLYVSICILLGHFILQLIPIDKKPRVYMPTSVLMTSLIAITVFSYFPALDIILYLKDRVGWTDALLSVTFVSSVGQVWILITLICIILGFISLIHEKKKGVFYHPQGKSISIIAMMFILLLVILICWTSHAASISKSIGFISQTVHFVCVTVWVGIMLVIGWWGQEAKHFRSFLTWYHPVATVCVVLIVAAGFGLMKVVNSFEAYPSTWAISYGQSLLIKHLLIIPLFAFAFINGFLMKRRLSSKSITNPYPWMRAESIIIILILTATAALSQQAPPHDIHSVLSHEGPSPLFTLFHQGVVQSDIPLTFGFNVTSILLFVIAIALLVSSVVSFKRDYSSLVSLSASVLFVITSYSAIMLSITY
ncbi:copper resistance D family protein [Caldalkalibacillus salinus]|uniref:copper resistance D family protein n=1 Tax=Caldalkalibacillus salinus TaxID=2803787 RepID=UPI001922D07A|nr:CopD family protein [Caldalkalibacillus salinus]